ncbi:MAG: hypothetical protein M1821_006337 [Bathelium mastoideum]|nr:MAG: hypothetical protein M1821_006337 [Bathelium mastoideum]KAI9693616.1 MAG: hypothetical protein M1822_002887 [Bathelium mastoideum]
MESLLSLAFDNLSSKDDHRLRKGLRQIEGLLAQLCLPPSLLASPSKRRPSALPLADPERSQGKSLSELTVDPAYIEFFRLQESFEWNVTSRLLATLDNLLGHPSSHLTNTLILSNLMLLQGLILLHPPSRHLLSPSLPMTSVLDLLDVNNPPAIQSSALLLLVIALLGHPANTRNFERLDGLRTVTSLFKAKGTTGDVKLKAVEFFYSYLMSETPIETVSEEDEDEHEAATSKSAPATSIAPEGGATKLAEYFSRSLDGGGGARVAWVQDGKPTKTTQEKQEMLGRYLSNVEDLLEDLQKSSPFGAKVS